MDYSPIQLHSRYQRLRHRGSLRGLTNEIRRRQKKTRVVIQRQAIRKTLEPSEVIFRQFHVATHTSPERAQHALADDILQDPEGSSVIHPSPQLCGQYETAACGCGIVKERASTPHV